MSILLFQRTCSSSRPIIQSRYGSNLFRKLRRERERSKTIFNYTTSSGSTPRVYAWGRTNTGALGVAGLVIPDTPGKTMSERRTYPARIKILDELSIKCKQVTAGRGFTAFLTKSKDENVLIGTGVNTESQIGYQEDKKQKILDYVLSPAPIHVPLFNQKLTKFEQISAGRAHLLVLTDREGVYSLGHNGYGQCGRSIVPGENLRGSTKAHRIVELPETVNRVVAGMDHSVFLTKDGEVFSCGFGTDFQTGLGKAANVTSPEQLKGDFVGTRIVDVSAGADTNLAVNNEGQLFGWGNNEYHQLPGLEESMVKEPKHIPLRSLVGIDKVKKGIVGGTIAAVLLPNGDVWTWGFGILGAGPKVSESRLPVKLPRELFGQNDLNADLKVIDIACGINYFAALTSNGELFTWGKNLWGQLGLGHEQDQFFPLRVSVPARVEAMAVGVDHMVALAKSHS